MALTLLRKLGERFNKAVMPASSSPAGLSSGSVLIVIFSRRDQSCLRKNALITKQLECQRYHRLNQRFLKLNPVESHTMKSTTKALLIIVALAAFAMGAVLKQSQQNGNDALSDQIDTNALLSARLKVGKGDELATVKQKLGKLTLVNFWASWCTPCRKEMPMFEAMSRREKAKGFQVIGIAIDSPEKAQPMLDSMDISYPILYAQNAGMRLMDVTGNPLGLLPYSLLLDQYGNVLEQVLGPIHEDEIANWIDKHL